MVSVIVPHRWRGFPLGAFVCPMSAKAVSSLHANRQLGGEDAQVRTDLGIGDLSETVVVEFAQSPGKHARQEQSRRELLRRSPERIRARCSSISSRIVAVTDWSIQTRF